MTCNLKWAFMMSSAGLQFSQIQGMDKVLQERMEYPPNMLLCRGKFRQMESTSLDGYGPVRWNDRCSSTLERLEALCGSIKSRRTPLKPSPRAETPTPS